MAAQGAAPLEFKITNQDKNQAGIEAATKVNDIIGAEYLKATYALATQANRYYDQLTDHGRNREQDADQAAEISIKKFQPQEQ